MSWRKNMFFGGLDVIDCSLCSCGGEGRSSKSQEIITDSEHQFRLSSMFFSHIRGQLRSVGHSRNRLWFSAFSSMMQSRCIESFKKGTYIPTSNTLFSSIYVRRGLSCSADVNAAINVVTASNVWLHVWVFWSCSCAFFWKHEHK